MKIFLNTKTKYILTILIVIDLLLFGAYYYFFMMIKNDNEQVSTLSSELSAEQSNEEKMDSIRNISRGSVADSEKLESLFVGSQDAVTFLKQIEDLTSFAGLSHSTESINLVDDPVLLPDNKENLEIVIDISGNWQDIYYFLSLFDNLPYAVHVNSLTLTELNNNPSNASSTESGGLWQGVLDFSAIASK